MGHSWPSDQGKNPTSALLIRLIFIVCFTLLFLSRVYDEWAASSMGSRCVGWVRGETVSLVIHPEKAIGRPNPTAARPHRLPPALVSAARTLDAAPPASVLHPGTSSSSSVYVCPELFLLRPHMLHPESLPPHPDFASSVRALVQRARPKSRGESSGEERKAKAEQRKSRRSGDDGGSARPNEPYPASPQPAAPSFPQPQELRHRI